MPFFGTLKDFFGGKKGLDKISAEELRRERIRLEQVEIRVTKDVEDLERRKQDLFTKGKDEKSQRQQMMLARKYKELDVAAQAKDRQLAMISRQLRVLTGFGMLKENSQIVKEMGVSGIVSKLNIEELQAFVEKATVEGQFQMERFAQLLKTMESPDGADMAAEDSDTLAVVAAMQEAREAESGDQELAVHAGMRKADGVLHRSESDAHKDDEPARV